MDQMSDVSEMWWMRHSSWIDGWSRISVLSALGAMGISPVIFWTVVGHARGAENAVREPEGPRWPMGKNLLVNGDFEAHGGVGTIPDGWEAVDEYVVTDNLAYTGWVAPRVETRLAGYAPRNGRFMVGLDTEMMGVDTAGADYKLPRAALYQTLTVPGRCQGTFSIHYNDRYSGALSHIAAIRLAFTVNHSVMKKIVLPIVPKGHHPPPWEAVPDVWSDSFYRVTKELPFVHNPVSGWKLGEIEVAVDHGDEPVELTLWIGIFENQDSTEIGYYRIDDASFVLKERNQ